MDLEIISAQLDAVMSNLTAMSAQVYALRMQIVGGQSAPNSAAGEQGCQHLETEDVGTFGNPETRCVACNRIV